MDYKKIIRTKKARAIVLNALRFLPDSLMLPLQYRIKLGRKLNLKHPERFTEKIQWYKMHYRNPIMHQCVDKYLVREYVRSKGLERILVPLIGKYERLEQIDWDSLPSRFVIKTTHGGGGLNVIICSDKSKLCIEDVKERIAFEPCSVKKNGMGREWAYYGLKFGIVVEELLVNNDNPTAGINDYKIFCYNGHAKYIIVDVDRYTAHRRNFYDRLWNNLHITSDCQASEHEIAKPENLDELLNVAEKLSEDFPYVRVDLYSVEGRVFFGELTFYPWSGYVQYTPDDADYLFGEDFILIKYGNT